MVLGKVNVVTLGPALLEGVELLRCKVMAGTIMPSPASNMT